jgi:hypothetical protein
VKRRAWRLIALSSIGPLDLGQVSGDDQRPKFPPRNPAGIIPFADLETAVLNRPVASQRGSELRARIEEKEVKVLCLNVRSGSGPRWRSIRPRSQRVTQRVRISRRSRDEPGVG